MKLRLAAEINKMPQKPEQSTRAAHKRWHIAILSVGTLLLHTIATVTMLDATAIALATTVATMLTTVAATTSLNAYASTTEYPRRSIRVGYNGNAVIVCKTDRPYEITFHEVFKNKTSQPLNVTDEDLKHNAVLFLRNVIHDATYRCMRGEHILSETILTIAARDLTSPDRIQMGSGDDAAFVLVHHGYKNLNYSQRSLNRDYYDDIRDIEKIKLINIDSDAIILLIRNASAQKSIFKFILDDKSTNECELDVGKAPESVKSFKCVGASYDNMTCTITFPTNNLGTKYEITYKVDGTGNFSCELEDTDFPDKLGEITKYLKLLSNTDGRTCIYYPSVENYTFTLIATNVLGQYKNEYTINNHESIVPAILKVNQDSITSNSVHLTWSIAQQAYYSNGLEFEITVKPDDFEKYSRQTIQTNALLSFTLDLPYAYWNYTLYIKARINDTKGEWSKPTQLKCQTAPRRPQRAPHTNDGGFHINQETISLYWEGLAANERNGPNFTYVIQALDMHGRQLHLKETVATSIDFPWPDIKVEMYKVYTRNAVDVSPNVSIIHLPSKKSVPSRILDPPSEIEQLYENGVYKLKWKQPSSRVYGKLLPSNYTIFWCRAPIHECEQGTMHFTVVNNTLNEYPLPSEQRKQKMAVAANFPSGSSGLNWPTCYADLNEALKKPKRVKVKAESESRILLQWSPDNCRNAFDGYNITYCIWDNVMESKCLSVIENNSRSNNFTLTNLKTYTFYNISVQLYGKNNRTSPPSDVESCQTDEAAPEPPTNLHYEANDITSHSAKISWKAPNVTNGVLKKYYIWYRNYKEDKANYIEVPRTKQSAIITQLKSGSVYEIWLTAWTTMESNKSLSRNITTMIGIPKRPENVDLLRVGDEYILSWDAAEYSNELFYELIFNDNNDQKILTVKRTSSIVQKHECRLKYPECRKGVQKMEVRAVNVVAEKDLDKSAFAIDYQNMLRLPRSADPAYNGSIVEKQTTTQVDISNKNNGQQKKRFAKNSAYKYKTYNTLECIVIDEGISTALPDDIGYYMLKSEAKPSNTNYNCSTVSWTIIVAALISISIFLAATLWGFMYLRRQSNIPVKLPDTLIERMKEQEAYTKTEDNISNVSTKTADDTTLINIDDTFVSSSSSGSESGVAGISDSDTDTPSTSSEEVDKETSNSSNHSSHQQSALSASPGQIKPTNPTSNTSGEPGYSSFAEILAKSRPANNNNNNINKNFYVKEDEFRQLSTKHAAYVKEDEFRQHAARNCFVNTVERNYSQMKPAAAPSNRLQTPDEFNYVKSETLLKAHTASLWTDNKQTENRLQEQLPQPETIPLAIDHTHDYVPHDPAPMHDASDSANLENEISQLALLQPSFSDNSTHAQPNIFRNIALTSNGYVNPDSLKRVAAPHNAMSAVNNDATQKPLQQQNQNGYVTADFWSQQNKRN